MVKELVREAVDAHLRSMEEDIRTQVKECLAAQTERLAADVVRAVAEEKVQTTVQRMIPSMVEEAIKAEIKRLTDAA